jgi:hypothetical protein
MTERPCDQREQLLDLLYGEGDDMHRARIAAHVAGCTSCSEEMAGFDDARNTLRAWSVPDTPLGFRVVADSPVTRRWWQPVWGLAAAAVLVLAAAAGMANLEVRYGPEGLTLRTGWMHASSPVPATAAAARVMPASVSPEDLRASEHRLRAEFAAARNTPAVVSQLPASANIAIDAEVLRRVRLLIEDSEKRQNVELAFRLRQVVQDVERQRQADLGWIKAGFGEVQGMTGAEVARQRETLNYLLRASQQQR